MATRYRKSFNIGGVRVNVNKKSMSVSAGGKGARYTVNSSGRRTTTVRAPGTGMSYTSTSGARSTASTTRRTSESTAAPAPAVSPANRKPGLFAPKAEKSLHIAVHDARENGPTSAWTAQFDQASTDNRYAFAAHTLGGLFGAQLDLDWAIGHLHAALASGIAPQRDSFVVRYSSGLMVGMEFAGGVRVTLPLSRELLGLLLSSMLSDRGDIQASLDVLNSVSDIQPVRVQRADLSLKLGHAGTTVELTDGVSNTDDLSVILLAARALALRDLGHLQAALDVTKEALRYPSRAVGARALARVARGHIQLDMGKKSPARNEAERVLAESSSTPGLDELLARFRPTPGAPD